MKRGVFIVLGLFLIIVLTNVIYAAEPYGIRISPVNSSSKVGVREAFVALYIDSDGYDNIYETRVRFLGKDGNKKRVVLRYSKVENKVYVRDNSGSSPWIGGYIPGSNNLLESSYVEINVSRIVVENIDKDKLKVRWPVTFKENFTGNYSVELYVSDINNSNYNDNLLKNFGTWNVVSQDTQKPPCISQTCSELGKTCGTWDNGCGTIIDCGECPPPTPSCGNNQCETGESCSSCSQDCGSCPVTCIDNDNDNYNSNGGSCGAVDCNDNNNEVNPGKNEVCYNNIDDNCNGIINEGCGVSSNGCSGCLFGNSCYSIGIRIVKDNEPSYCDVNKTIKSQKNLDSSCENNFECKSNECSVGKCIFLEGEVQELKTDIKSLEEEVQKVKSEVSFFKKLLCGIKDFLGIQGYNECIEVPPASVCGNNQCETGESCSSCSQDCGSCPPPAPVCGNAQCEIGESCSSCSEDCGVCTPVCGDGSCNGKESCSSCSQDCGICTPTCGDKICNGAETCSSCPGDCNECPPPTPSCGNNQCETGESCTTCSQDCGSCPSEGCGDGICSAQESCTLCSKDCGVCNPLTISSTINSKLGPLTVGGNADDPAIWIHPTDKSKSLLFLSDKDSGIYVYDLSGKKLQQIDFKTSLNNIDLRYDLKCGNNKIDIVAGNLRDTGKLSVLKVNANYGGSVLPVTLLSDQNSASNSIQKNSYGFTLYQKNDGTVYAFDKPKSSTPIKQWRIDCSADEKITTVDVRTVNDVSIGVAEGFIADDQLGYVYFVEEAKGIHKYNADPSSSNLKRLSFFASGDGTASDREGIALYECQDGTGYLVLSSQGNSLFKVYGRKGDNKFLKTFNAKSVAGTDGLDVSSESLPNYLNGFAVIHDGGANYNIYDWKDIAGSDLKSCSDSVPSQSVCGNNIKEGTEECDGQDLGGKTCQNLGFDTGNLKCSSQCKLDSSQCSKSVSCTISNVKWEKTNVVEGEIVKLVLTGNNCALTDQIEYKIYEDDGIFGSDFITSFVKGYNQAEWVTQYFTDQLGGPEYYFTANIVGSNNILNSKTLGNPLLEVSSSQAVCGNAQCEIGESCSSCSQDCGSCSQEVKVAFIGDQGLGTNAESVLQLIKNEKADMVIHAGDFDYKNNPTAWDGQINKILGENFPYFIDIGNHDTSKWSGVDGYQDKFKKRLDRISGETCTGDLGVKSSCSYKGLFFVLSGAGTSGSGHDTYIKSELSNSNAQWEICNWHKNQRNMQVGGKGDEAGWPVYEACREGGAIIVTAHEHSYERTKTLTNIQQLTVDTQQHPLENGIPSRPDSVAVTSGKTFVVVSGLGGASIRNQDRCLPYSYPYGGGEGCNYIWAKVYTTDQNAKYGALFITFNVGGNSNKAMGYFKNIDGAIIDSFEILNLKSGGGGGAFCGDNECNAGETCSSCSSDCGSCPAPISVCGNGIIESGEQCDGTNLGGETCSSVDPNANYVGGSLSCSNCKFVTTACLKTVCGNNKVETGEQCDGTALNGKSCTSEGFTGGTLKCTNCNLDTSSCTKPVCGNSQCETGESCSSCSQDCGSCPPPGTGKGIWISKEEIMALPISGAAWDKVLSEAKSDWGSACLNDNGCVHDVKTLAGALVAVRMNDEAMRAKTIKGLEAAMSSPTSRTLELARGLQTYVIAADIIGYNDPAFKTWLKNTIDDTSISGREGGGLYYNSIRDSSNWGGHERASIASALIYLNDNRISELVRSYKEFIGEDVSPKTLNYKSTNWHSEPNDKAGVNRKGSKINGIVVSGVLPEDWRRGGEFKWPPSTSGYMWEGMQGYVVTAVILHRAGYVPFNSGDNVVVRSMDMLYGKGEASVNSPVFSNPPSGDDTWIPWVVNHYAGTSYPTSTANYGKNMGWTDWTHAK